ncbi:hypothetical protein GTO27_02725 [Candidatus Bathyarchaeota archaeon]|nr:hypothetical protein [Candidatus Bathyarchaeota archaeon]
MSWEKESILVLVKAAPNWSNKYKKYEICTAGVAENNGWRRLYPFPESVMLEEDVRVWDIIEVETTKPTDDPRTESRKIRNGSVKVVGRIESKKEKRRILADYAESSLGIALEEKRSLTLIEPNIENFKILRSEREPPQFTLNGKPFRKHPYGDVKLYYSWSCPKCCTYCKSGSHTSRCFDWGANLLFRKLLRKSGDEKDTRIKVRNKLHYEMKYDNDTWFALGTTRQRPWKRWMIVGLLWMKREKRDSKTRTLTDFA